MTQAQLAERAQLSVSFVSILEGGQSSNDPTPAILGRLARALGITLAKLAESRDSDTGDHLERISVYSTLLAQALSRHPGINVNCSCIEAAPHSCYTPAHRTSEREEPS